ncbi:hypothetical protein ICN30_00750 [Polynucleobacter sp. 31A-FELB]|uniref:hypothetical protein n=1 Tax=Polynucleobacter sp. 31A-FELB TaxID=2689096 RepID=UPI001C0D15C1|nr:hypothetical protein [Polynucleobacter sp. 31A-FELB]MBU3586360.1 hypothetical protein [Polynucleobacter sp. 31A-FELB]
MDNEELPQILEGKGPRKSPARDEDNRTPFLSAFSKYDGFEALHQVAEWYLDIPKSLAGLWLNLDNLPEILACAKQWSLGQGPIYTHDLDEIFHHLGRWIEIVQAERQSPELQKIYLLSKVERRWGPEAGDGEASNKKRVLKSIGPPFWGIEEEHPVWMTLWYRSATPPTEAIYTVRDQVYRGLQGLYLSSYMRLRRSQEEAQSKYFYGSDLYARLRDSGRLLRKIHSIEHGFLLERLSTHCFAYNKPNAMHQVFSDIHANPEELFRQEFAGFADVVNFGYVLRHPSEFAKKLVDTFSLPGDRKKIPQKKLTDSRIYEDHHLFWIAQGFPAIASKRKSNTRPHIEWIGPEVDTVATLFEEGAHPGEYLEAEEIFFEPDDFLDPASTDGGPRELPPLNTLYAAARARYRMEIMRAQSFRNRLDRARVPLFVRVIGVLQNLYSQSLMDAGDQAKALLNETVKLCAVALFTGHSLKEATSLHCFTSIEELPSEWRIAYSDQYRVWLRPYPVPDRNKNARIIFSDSVAVSPRIAFWDIWSVGQLLPKTRNKKWFTQTEAVYKKVFITQIAPALIEAGVDEDWVGVDSIGELLPSWFEGLEEGELLRNCALFGRSSPQSEVQSHYAALDRAVLDDYYCKIMRNLWKQIQVATPDDKKLLKDGSLVKPLFSLSKNTAQIPNSLTGNDWAPKVEGIKTLLEMLRAQIADHDQQEPHHYHNLVVAYTGIALSIVTAFRNANTPILDLGLIDQETGFLHMEEKDRDNGSHARLVWIPDDVRACVSAYLNHLKRLWVTLSFQTSPELKVPATKNRDIRIYGTKSFALSLQSSLFLFEEVGGIWQPKEFSGRRLQALLDSLKLGSWPIPNNGRHFLATTLFNEKQKSFATVIKTVMGHWQLGESPWGPDSAMDPYYLREALKSPFEKLLGKEGIDFQVIDF